ncbi:MAG: hypothetical protein ACE5HI_15760, partial [bacterium]
ISFIAFILINLSFAASFASPTNRFCHSQPGHSYILEDFRALEHRFLKWDRKYQNAPLYSDSTSTAKMWKSV